MSELSTSHKGAATAAEIAAATIRLDLVVLRPLGDGGRYDLALDTGRQLVRVRCKWASRQGEVVMAYCITSRHRQPWASCAPSAAAIGADRTSR